MTTISIDVKGLKEVAKYLDSNSARVDEAIRLSLNDAARFGRTMASRAMVEQVNLQKGYISDRMKVTFAQKGGEQEAVITARWRPTSLSRFVTRMPAKGKPIPVSVKRGGAATKVYGFPVRLRQGRAAVTDSKFNAGIAMRLPKGKKPKGTHSAFHAESMSTGKTDVYLLYGPSISQMFKSVRFDISAPLATRLGREFVRQYERLNRG